MGTTKINNIIYSILCILFLLGCNDSSIKMVPKETHDAKIEEIKELNIELQNKVKRNIELEETIHEVIKELRNLTNETLIIRNNIENNHSINNNIEEIKIRLRDLKKKLSYQSNTNINNTNSNMILISQELLKTINEKEAEINSLKIKIKERENLIRYQKDSIQNLKNKLNKEIAEKWYHIGIELHNIAQNMPTVKKEKDKKEINKKKYYFFLKSKYCFEQANKLGRSDSFRMINIINHEIRNLISEYPDIPKHIPQIF